MQYQITPMRKYPYIRKVIFDFNHIDCLFIYREQIL